MLYAYQSALREMLPGSGLATKTKRGSSSCEKTTCWSDPAAAVALREIKELIVADIQIALSDAERQFLVNYLESVLKERYVEEHRTRTPSYRQEILRQEALIQQVLTKLRAAKT
jgi:hypothetical protein